MTATVPQWHHDPTHPTAADHEPGDHGQGPTCFGCWCYGCGARTDAPRDRRGDTRDLPDSDNHRWCYE